MRFLVIYAHPVEGSFQSALHRRAVDTLAAAGHDVDDCDLYAQPCREASLP
jgi:NAD(P)H dehydrogenase (quinone)